MELISKEPATLMMLKRNLEVPLDAVQGSEGGRCCGESRKTLSYLGFWAQCTGLLLGPSSSVPHRS